MTAETMQSERESLPAHVDLCATRYRGLESRLTRIEYALYALTAVLLLGTDKAAAVIAKLLGIG